MSISVRNQLTAGVAAVAATALVMSPVLPSAPAEASAVAASQVDLAATIKPLVLEPLSADEVKTAREVIARLDSDGALPLAAPAPQNAASDLIVNVYQFIQYFVDYGVNVADYVLGFIPYGYLIGDQVSIVYYSLVRPISNSVVYDLVVPVVNDPLNISSYVNGLIAVGAASITALINTGIAEFNYFLGGFLPPLPPLPLAAVDDTTPTITTGEVPAPVESPAGAVQSLDEPIADDLQGRRLASDITSATLSDVTDEPVDGDPIEVAAGSEPTEATTSASASSIQGEVRTGALTVATGSADESGGDGNSADGPADDTPADPTPTESTGSGATDPGAGPTDDAPGTVGENESASEPNDDASD